MVRNRPCVDRQKAVFIMQREGGGREGEYKIVLFLVGNADVSNSSREGSGGEYRRRWCGVVWSGAVSCVMGVRPCLRACILSPQTAGAA